MQVMRNGGENMRIFIKKRDSELSDSEDARLLLKKVLSDYHSLDISFLT